MPVLGGSPLGLIGVKSGPTSDGMSTFNGGKSRNLNVNLYNSGREADKAKLKKAGLSRKDGAFSVFSGGAAVKAWGNINTTGKEENAGLGTDDSYNGITRKTLHNNDVYDTSILNIVEKTSGSAAALRPSDFAYLKNLGVYPNNRLIVCRRFGGPQIDNIFGIKSNPIVVLISWRIPGEDFLDISFGEQWEAAAADFTDIVNGIGQDLLKMSPLGGAGGELFNAIPLPGWSETLTRIVLAKIGVYEQNAGGDRLPAGNPNLIKEAKRRKTVAQGEPGSGLDCKVSIKVTVEYEQKFISGIDPTIVYMDILQNALRFGTSPSDNYGLSGGFGASIIAAVKNPKILLNKVVSALREAVQEVVKTVTEFFKQFVDEAAAASAEADAAVAAGGEEDPEESGSPDPAELQKEADEKKKALENAKKASDLITNFFNTIGSALSKTVNKYEEAVKGVVYALTGMPSTPWHVTIGNPLRPIFCSGDMYTTTVQLTMGSTLAFNDLPANIKIDFTLENARPWGLQEIMAKFNTGNIRTVNVVKDVTMLNPSEALSSNAYHYATQSGETATTTSTTTPGGSTPATNPPPPTNDVVSKEGLGDTSVNSNPNSSDPPVEEPVTNNLTATLDGEAAYLQVGEIYAGGSEEPPPTGPGEPDPKPEFILLQASAKFLINGKSTPFTSGIAKYKPTESIESAKALALEAAKQNAIKNYK
jgi:hypothetical protein